MNRISITLVFFISILFCENSIFPGRKSRKKRTTNILKCYTCQQNGRINKNTSAYKKNQVKKHLMRCNSHHYDYNQKVINSISKGEFPTSFHVFTTTKTKQNKKKITYQQKKPQHLKEYFRTVCCACNHKIYTKKNDKPYTPKQNLMKHYILCHKFNIKYIEEFETKQFSITTLKQYAKVYAYNANIIDSKSLSIIIKRRDFQ